jgi:hypothetical protein
MTFSSLVEIFYLLMLVLWAYRITMSVRAGHESTRKLRIRVEEMEKKVG